MRGPTFLARPQKPSSPARQLQVTVATVRSRETDLAARLRTAAGGPCPESPPSLQTQLGVFVRAASLPGRGKQ